jgi:hypothetical protein
VDLDLLPTRSDERRDQAPPLADEHEVAAAHLGGAIIVDIVADEVSCRISLRAEGASQ